MATEHGSVLVTGVASGLGKACAEHLRSLGFTVLGWDATVPSEPDDDWTKVDVTSSVDLETASSNLPPLVGVINCAGVANRLSIDEITVEQFSQVLAVNLVGTFAVAKATLSALEAGRGTFVAIGSVAGSSGFVDRSAYSTSKAGVKMLVKSIAIEWAGRGVRALCVSPGFVNAGMSARGQVEGGTSPRAVIDHTPSRRLVEASEIATVVAFAISDAASGMTGSEIIVDAGFNALTGF
jgi:NAD(P)-dependent dehydrogenase (short-subunit alcohol dehydrogenase family)